MSNINLKQTTHRRGFLGYLASGAAALGLTALASPIKLNAQQQNANGKKPAPAVAKDAADLWFNKIKGKHRVAFDVTRPHEVFPFAWPRVFLITNGITGSPESECGVVVVLRHAAIPYAFKDHLWAKYGFDEVFKAGEIGPVFQAADAPVAGKTRNPFWNPKPGDFKIPGFGEVAIGINELQASGVLFCVCNAAMTVYSTVIAGQMNLNQEEVYKEWKEGLIPGIQPVPSGVWAIGRAKEHGCAYIFAG